MSHGFVDWPGRAPQNPRDWWKLWWGRMLRKARSLAAFSLRAAVGGLLLQLAACASTDAPRPVQPEFDLHHPDALRRTLAIHDVAAHGDRRWLPDLVELLDDTDATVRLQAGAALKEMTGHDVGYQAFAGPEERRVAMAAWRAWLEPHGASRGGP